MKIFDILVYNWKKIKSWGTDSNRNDNAIIELINQMGLIGGIACLFMVLVSVMIESSVTYSVMAFLFGLGLFIPALLNKYHYNNLSKDIICGHPTLISLYILLCGGNIGEESILTISLFMIFILCRKEPARMTKFYIIAAVSYLSAEILTLFYPPLITIVDNPYDNFIAFAICVSWLLMIIWLYQKQVNRQKVKKDQLIQELRLKNASLKKTSEELEQFTYIASHDLKSPLRTIISFLDLIKRDVTRQRYDDLLSKLDFARSGAEQMNFLVTDILEYSKITNGKRPKKNMINLQALAEKVTFNLTDTIQRKNVDLYIFPLPEFYCNETEMTVLFQNFIENGIKYNEEATPNIFIKSHLNEDQLTLQFIDNGIGIEEQYFKKIFLLFKRLHTNENYKGTGLGLGLCKKIIDDMKGTVEVESTINVGTTFTVRLPVEQIAKPQTVMEVAFA